MILEWDSWILENDQEDEGEGFEILIPRAKVEVVNGAWRKRGMGLHSGVVLPEFVHSGFKNEVILERRRYFDKALAMEEIAKVYQSTKTEQPYQIVSEPIIYGYYHQDGPCLSKYSK